MKGIYFALFFSLSSLVFGQTITLTSTCAVCPPSGSTNGSAVVSAYGGPGCTGSGTINGTMTQGVAVSGVTMSLSATVTQVGTWSLSATNNGVTFTGSGTFTAIGCQTLTLNAAGTPTTTGSFTWSTNSTPVGSVTATVVSNVGTIASLDCAGAVHSGTLTGNTVASGVSSTIAYTGGNGAAHMGQSVSSTGVTGLTATLAPGSFANGTGNLVYSISGTPSAGGTAMFALNIGGQTCNLTRSVTTPIVIPATITLAQNRLYLVASVYDQDYLPYSAATGPATTSIQTADGTNEPVTVDIQGVIPTAGGTVRIPVTTTGSGTMPAFSSTISIPANVTEDGLGRDITLSWVSQPYTSSTTFISASIVSVSQILNVKKLDINSGIGNDALGILMGTFTFPYNNAGATTSFQVRAISGVPDRRIGDQTTQGGVLAFHHQFLYIPKLAEDGKVWLNHNLGAQYTDLNHAAFNPIAKPVSISDFNAFGNFFQWGRYSDGHELIKWTAASSAGATRVNLAQLGAVSDKFNRTESNRFAQAGTNGWGWANNHTLGENLWSPSSANNPCPQGFVVPTHNDYVALFGAIPFRDPTNTILENEDLINSTLGFTYNSYRSGDTIFDMYFGQPGGYTFLGTRDESTTNLLLVAHPYLAARDYNPISGQLENTKSFGYTVRCIKE